MGDTPTGVNRTDRERLHLLYQTVDSSEWSHELVKRVYHLGTPYLTDTCSTASLTVVPNGETRFNFNRQFFDGLGGQELIFVILHEALHYAFRHHERRESRQPAIWNIACDLVVNSFLLERVGFRTVSSPAFRRFIASAVTFENVGLTVSRGWLSLSAEEVHALLEKDFGRLSQRAADIAACDEHHWVAADDTEPSNGDRFEELAEQARQAFRDSVESWGDHSLGEFRALGTTIEPARISWDLILSHRIASCITLAYEQRWAPPNRRISWLFPKVILPAEQEIEKTCSSILLAIDASGSIPDQLLERFFRIARTIPRDRVDLAAISFDTRAHTLDVWAKQPQIQGGGGTSFGAVEQYAMHLQRYPDLVVVLTDGHAPRPKISCPGRWFWLITNDGTSDQVAGIGRHCRIEDLVSARPENKFSRHHCSSPRYPGK